MFAATGPERSAGVDRGQGYPLRARRDAGGGGGCSSAGSKHRHQGGGARGECQRPVAGVGWSRAADIAVASKEVQHRRAAVPETAGEREYEAGEVPASAALPWAWGAVQVSFLQLWSTPRGVPRPAGELATAVGGLRPGAGVEVGGS